MYAVFIFLVLFRQTLQGSRMLLDSININTTNV